MTVAPARHRLQSIDAERSVLGALLADPERYYEIGPDLAESDFADPVHAAVFAAIRRLHEERRSVDFVTVAEVLKTDAGGQRAGGSAFLGELAAGVPTSSHAAHYAAIIREIAAKKKEARFRKTERGTFVATGHAPASATSAAEDAYPRCPKCSTVLDGHRVTDPDGRLVCGECGHAFEPPAAS